MDDKLTVKMLANLKQKNRNNPIIGEGMGNIGWMQDLVDMVRDFDKEKDLKLEGDRYMIFSKRAARANLAEIWLEERGVSKSPLNIATALNELGYLK